MKRSTSRKIFGIALVALLMVVSASIAMGQGRGRRAGGQFDRKCDKFVNCHDARDGRLDGRGPNRGTTVTDPIFGRTRRTRDIDDDNIWRRRRDRDRDRDRDDDDRWRRRRDRDGDTDRDRDGRWRRRRDRDRDATRFDSIWGR